MAFLGGGHVEPVCGLLFDIIVKLKFLPHPLLFSHPLTFSSSLWNSLQKNKNKIIASLKFVRNLKEHLQCHRTKVYCHMFEIKHFTITVKCLPFFHNPVVETTYHYADANSRI